MQTTLRRKVVCCQEGAVRTLGDGWPLDTLLLEAPDGAYAEPVRALDEHGAEVRNVFPRTLVAETWGPQGEPTTAPVPLAPAPPR